MPSRPRVFTIPASAPFLPTLIAALADGRLVPGFPAGRDPLALATATLYLPTRRACRLARDVFLTTLKADAAILPRIVPIGDVDEDEIAFAEAATGGLAGAALELPEALGGFERNALLAELILKWATQPDMRAAGGVSLVARTPASALALASDLARLMDDMITRQVPWTALDSLVPAALDIYWQQTLEFLKIARHLWPAILQEHGKIEPAERRDRLIDAESARLANTRAPVIAAGSTGSMPVTAKLLATIAGLPHGAVVLPGLDMDLDPASWKTIADDGDDDGQAAHSHPQFAMHALLQRIGILREAVTELAPPEPHGREQLLSEALRPAATTELWQERLSRPDFPAHADTAMAGITVVEAANAEEEALAIAVALREAVETPGKTAALVTPDRALARRVIAGLARWNVAVDDSGGNALCDTEAGVFARLVAEAGLKGLEPVTLLALLKHPMCKADARAVGALERAILRGTRPSAGTAGLDQALTAFRGELAKLRRREDSRLHRLDPRADIRDFEIEAAVTLVTTLRSAVAALEELKAGTHRFAEIARRHRSVVLALGSETEDLAEAFDDIEAYGRLAIAPADYAELFRAAISDRVVRPPQTDVRVRIYGPLEARLQQVDRMVLGGMVEGMWPPQTRADPWLSRPMRHELKLDLPERRIGLSAHDFAQALGAKEVILTRAAKLAGAPTVASRFVQRLAAVAGEARWNEALERGSQYATMARALDLPAKPPKSIARPEPKPARDVRPSALSVTEIELWLRDPYSIYARHILRLRPLDAVDTPPGARDRGTVIHNAIGAFAEAYKDGLPADAVGELLKLGEQHFATLAEFPDARAFWWPRFERIAGWFATTFETERRANFKRLDVEVSGALEIPFGDRTFTLRARADRIEHLTDGRYAILDYKTGQVHTPPQVKSGLAPQLTLEGAILRAGRFGEIPKGASIAEFAYISIRGGEPPGEMKPIAWKDSTPDTEADMALRRLTAVIARFDDPETPYRSRERPMFLRRNPGDYDHLARVREWSVSGGAEDAEGGAE